MGIWRYGETVSRWGYSTNQVCYIFLLKQHMGYTKISLRYMLLFLLFSWPPIREVCPNYEVVMFQPRIGTPPDLVSVANCYVVILIKPDTTFSAHHPMSARVRWPLTPLHYIPCRTSCIHTWSLSQPRFTCICPSISRPIAPWIRLCYLTVSLDNSTPDILSSPRPCCRQNIF